MSNLNMNEQQGGRLVQATDTPIATGLGNRVSRAQDSTKVDARSFADASGEMAMAKAQEQAAQQVSSVVQDGMARVTNLKIAEEETKKQLYEVDWHTKEAQARTDSKQQALDQGLDTDGEHALYQDLRAKSVGELQDKYAFHTKVGNDIQQRAQLWGDRADSDYVSSVVVPRHVDAFKANTMKLLDSRSQQLATTVAQETDPTKIGQAIQANVNAINETMSSPQNIAVFGAAGAAAEAKKRVDEATKDAVVTMITRDPQSAIDMLRNQTGDPSTDPLHAIDPSQRQQLYYIAEKERSTRKAEAAAVLKETQDKNEVELIFAIDKGQLRGAAAMNYIEKQYRAGNIDQSHAEKSMTRVTNNMERDRRSAEARAERAQRLADKREVLMAPVRASLEMGMQLNPNDIGHVKSVNAYADSALAQSPKATPQEKVATLTDIAVKTGVVPTSLKNGLYQMIHSDDPKVVVQGSQIIEGIRAKAPNAHKSFDDETSSISTQVRLGIPPKQAATNIQMSRTMAPEAVKTYETNAGKDFPKAFKSMAKELGLSDKDVPIEVSAGIREIYVNQYKMTGGNREAAQAATLDIASKTYGMSHVTGKPTMMYNPPEGANGPNPLIDKQLKTDLSSFGLTPDKVKLTANGHGSYDILVLNDKGAVSGYLVDSNTGKKQVWAFDQDKAMKEVIAAQVAEAQKKRDEYLKPPSANAQYIDSVVQGVTNQPAFGVKQGDVGSFVPRGAKKTQPVNTTELKFGKFTSETK